MTRQLLRDERGATVVLVAGMLLVLVGFGALAVDWGAGVAQRRADRHTNLQAACRMLAASVT